MTECIFESIRNKLKVSFENQYLQEYKKKVMLDQFSFDRWKAKKACEAFNYGFCSSDQFIIEIKKIFGPWDPLARSIAYSQVEATLNCHVCAFWDECKEGCSGNRTFEDTAPLWKI